MATRKKKNPYNEYGAQAIGQGAPSEEVANSANPYNEYGKGYDQSKRDPSLVWDWNEKPSKEQTATAVVEAKKDKEKAKEPARKRSLFEWMGDAFEANSPEDKAKRKSVGQHENYQEQKGRDKEVAQRAQTFNFAKDELDKRREFYLRNGVDIDKAAEQKKTYDEFQKRIVKEDGKAEFTYNKDDNVSDILKFEQLGKKLQRIEKDYLNYEASQSPNQSTVQQVSRNFKRGLAEQIVSFPGSVQTLAAGALDVVSPEGSRVDKFAQGQYDAGKKNLEEEKQGIIDQGLGTNPADNRVVGNLAAGAGSLTTSVLLGLATGGSSTTAQGASFLAKAKAFLNPGLPGAVFGVNAGAEQYVGALDAGKSDFQAFGTALVGGAAEGYLEKLGVDKFLGASGSTVKKFFTRAVSEGLQEASQSLAQSGVTSTYSSVDFSDALLKALEEGGYGAVVGGGGSLALDLSQNMVEKGVPKEVADETARLVEEKITKIADEELPQDGDTIIKALQENGITPEAGQLPQGEQPIPDNGDEIVKELQGKEAGVPPVDAPLPDSGDEIVKELQSGIPGQTVTSLEPTDTPEKGKVVQFNGEEHTIKNIVTVGKETKYELADKDGKTVWTNEGGLNNEGKLPDTGDEIVKELQGKKETKTLYHGTVEDFEDFDTKKSGGRVWFTEDKEAVKDSGLSYDGKKPLKIIERDLPNDMKLATAEQGDKYNSDQLIQMGYDGIKHDFNDGTPVYYEIFNPKKLKKKNNTDTSPRKIFLTMFDKQLKGTALEGAAEDTWGNLNFVEKTGDTETLYKTFKEYEIEDEDKALEWKKRIKDGERPYVLTETEDGVERVVDGRHKLWAYKELGIKTVPVINGSEKVVTKKGAVKSLNQKEKVAKTVESGSKSIKQVAEETGIKEPNVRRILGVGAKEGVFERVDKGIYKLRINGSDIAYVEVGDATESLPRLASEGFKADLIFLDIPYDTPAVKGGNRGANYDLLSVEDFDTVIKASKEIVRDTNTPIVHMYSNAKSGMNKMMKYNAVLIENGYIPVGKGEYQKTYKDGSPVGFPTSAGFTITPPEGIIVYSLSGKLDKELDTLNFTLVRPKGYQTEKPAELLKSIIEMTTEEGDVVLDPFAGSGVTGAEAVKSGRKSYNIEKNAEVAENITKPRIEKAPKRKGAVKPIGKIKADYELRYPELKDLPEILKGELDKTRTVKPFTTLSGREIMLTEDDINKTRVITIYKNEAIKEARLKKDLKSVQRFKSFNVKTLTQDEAAELSTYLFGKPKMSIEYEGEKIVDNITRKKASDVLKVERYFDRATLQEIMKLLPGLSKNPILTVSEDKDGEMQVVYKDDKNESKIYLRALGFTGYRLMESGIKVGDTIDLSEVMKSKGKLPVIRNTKSGVDYHKGRDFRTQAEFAKSEVARTPEELKEKIDQLNKAAQYVGILRKGNLKSKKAAGLHQAVTKSEWEKGKLGTVKLRDSILKDPAAYMSVLAHELSHAMEFAVNGSTSKTLDIFGELTKEEKKKVTEELQAIVNNIEGESMASSDPSYYYKPTEMLARYVETMLTQPSKLTELAPFTTDKFEQAQIRHPQIAELIDALEGKIDEGFSNRSWDAWRDLRQIYQKHLGKRVGNIAYNSELVRRARLQNWDKEVGVLIKKKFKKVKDSPSALFRAAEAINRQDEDGNIEYGTRDFAIARDTQEVKQLKDNGYVFVKIKLNKDGKEEAVFAKQRYTEEQGRELFESLTENGQKLVRDFTANKKNAKDMFNRELIKDVFKIDSELEGWVHRGLREKPKGRMTLSGKRLQLRQKKAGAKKQRTAEEGHVEDFKKQMEKALRELGDEVINNEFIEKQMARISKPIAKGQEPDAGWVEVTFDMKKGLRLPGEGGRDKVTMDKEDVFTGETETITFLKPEYRYQVPSKLVEHYRNIRQLPEEISLMQRIMTNISKYWAINVLVHGGTVGTNFIGGGIQYSAKVLNDFYVEVLSANVAMPQTRRNVAAMVQVLLPGGWSNAPDYIYGGHRSNFAGQFMTRDKSEGISEGIDKAGNIVLAPFSTVENYWKKVIMISEQGNKMPRKQLEKEMIKLSKEEEAMIGKVNEAIDLYAFDYDNVPMWLESWSRKGGLIKPFAKYPYKYGKMITNLATGVFDRTLSPQERAAKLLTLSTMMALALMLMAWRDDESEVPEGTDKTPSALDARGRLFLWATGNTDMFVRTAKYPFINIASIGKSMLEGDFEDASNVITDQLGTVGPLAKSVLILLGYTNKYEQYTPKTALIGQQVASFIPGFRVLSDIGKALDDKQRKPENFIQGIFSNLPVWGSEETKSTLRGDARTVKVPVEPEVRKKGETETIEKDVQVYKSDLLLSALTGIYITRINPEDAKQQALREKRNAAEKKIEVLLTDGKTTEAEDVAKEAGLTIPKGSYDYYRRLREKRQ